MISSGGLDWESNDSNSEINDSCSFLMVMQSDNFNWHPRAIDP